MKRKQLSLLLFLQKNALFLFAIFPIALSIFVQSRHIILLIGIRKSLLLLLFVLLFLSPLYFFIYQKSTRQRFEKLQSYAIYWIVGLAFFLRVILIYLLNTTFTSDFEDVYFFARDISIGMPFANLDKYPNIPLSLHLNMPALVLAAVFKVFGASIFVAKSFMVFLGVLSTFLVYVAGQVVSNEKVGIISAYFFALLPSTILYSGTLSGDYLAYPPMLLTIILYGIFLKSRDGKFAHKLLIFIALGASIGLMDWFRPLGIVLISSVVIATFMSKLGELSIWRLLLLLTFTIISYMATTQLALRISERMFETKILSSSDRIGEYLIKGLSPAGHGHVTIEDNLIVRETYARFGEDVFGAQKYLVNLAFSRIDQKDFIDLLVKKFDVIWASHDSLFDYSLLGSDDNQLVRLFQDFEALLWLTLCLFILFQSMVSFRELPPAVFVMQLFIMGFALLFLFMEVQNRYVAAIIPFSLLLSSLGIENFITRFLTTDNNSPTPRAPR